MLSPFWLSLRPVLGVIACVIGLAAPVASQQLNENCTVSILNRTVRVNPDGSWVLPNIPANLGQVRARATCVENGVTTSGESDFFTISANRMNAVLPIKLGSATQIPSSLALAPAQAVFNATGQTAQLTVTATYPNSSTRNVTASSTGTNYTTSNPAIAAVSAEGLVTAVASGTVVIQATNDGAAAIITARVVLSSTDSDGDGIPDDAEISLGLDPHNPVDAQEDSDRDDLTNLQEYPLGTNIRNRDTDGDGLSDGAEVNQHRTNPLLADTDGDLIPDGVEVQTETNPLDPNSFNLARALSSIEVTPPRFTLVVNTIIGEATQQLAVTGRLIDGTTAINLTPRSRGTNYSSSNLSVANFGATDGLVFAGGDGTATVTVTNSGHSAAVQATVSSFAPTALSFVTIPGFANNVDVSGDIAYVAAGSTGLQVVNVADRRAPSIIGSLNTPGNANDVRAVGNRVYVADGAAGLQIIDVTNPAAPALLGTLDTAGTALDVVVVGNRAYVAGGAAGLQIIDVTNPASPTLLGTLDTPGSARGVEVSGNVAVVADDTSFRTIDVTNPASPTALGSLATTTATDLTVDGAVAYLADYTGSMRVINFANPAAPQLLATTSQSLGGILTDVARVREFVFGADVFFVNGVPIFNVGNPGTPLSRPRLDFPARDDNGTGIAVDNTYVYLTADRSLTQDGASGDSRLYIGQYLTLEDRAGVPPTVSITSPAAGATFIEGMTIPVTVQAADDVQVAGVDFLVNGNVVFTDTAAPYEFTVTVPNGGPTLTLGARAVDLGSNIGVAPNVQVNVIPDPRTTVVGRVLDINSAPVQGATVSVGQQTATTNSDGTFSIAGVPTINGNITASASATVGGVFLSGKSAGVAPVPGGTTNVGDIVTRAGRKVAIFGAPSANSWNTDVRTKLQSTGLFTQVDAFLVSFGNPVPTLAQLREYDAVLVYSDTGFNNNVALGNVLADYMDAGGGVVLATFAFWDSDLLAIQGRIKTAGYLPFTTAGQSQPGGLTLVAVEPQHQILEGVTSLNGGGSSYHNSPITTTAGTTLVARWSNGQPLVGTKTPTAGRIVGLNFYPPSSTVRSDFWVSSTGGARLMGNALIWAASR
jgi:hypothetical protein